MSKILIVEDHESLLSAIQCILEGEGYEVLTATNGEHGLQVMQETRPDMIVADIMMPRMDGYAFYEAVRARPEWVPIPFIFLTAKSEKEDLLKGKELGAEDYLTKPFDPQELVVAVRARLGRSQAIRQATEVEFDRLKKEIVTVLSHELRTPLTHVRGYADMALEQVDSLSIDDLQDFLRGVKRGSDRLTRLVDDLLILVRFDTGQASDEFRKLACAYDDLALRKILEYVLFLHREPATASGVALEIDLEPDLPTLRLHEIFFVNALNQLIENGIKFSRDTGRRVVLRARPVEDGVEIAITDEGVGIPEQELAHLFERFRQIEREQLEQQGTGLGLAIAHDIIQLHGGRITVTSEIGVGSTFTIWLPRYEGEVGSKE